MEVNQSGEDKSCAFNNKKTIKVNACDFWRGFKPENNIMSQLLKDEYNVEISDNPDFLVYSCFGSEFKKYKNCVKIFSCNENIIPNFNECDYATGFEDIVFGDRYLRVMHAYDNPNVREEVLKEFANRRFCNFVYSNAQAGEGAVLRQEFFHKLSEYKHIDAPGRVCNNMQTDELEPREGDWYSSKLNFLKKYKFTIAFENSKSSGYTTEKLFQPLKSLSVPIYWGNPDIAKDVNPKSFINCNDYDSFDDVIKRVIELDNDDEQYLAMLKEKPILENSYLLRQKEELKRFFINIAEKGNKPYNKDPLNFEHRKEPKPKKTVFFKIKREILRLFGIKVKN